MNILMDASISGLNNNGGTKTIIRSAETLQDMGHDVVIWANLNRYTWHTPQITIVIQGVLTHLLKPYDAVIAVSDMDVEHALTIPAKKHFYWWRSFATWNSTEEKLLEKARKIKCIANSGWLQKHLEDNGIKCDLVYAGLDLDRWIDQAPMRDYTKRLAKTPQIGYLEHHRHKTKNSHMGVEITSQLNASIYPLRSNEKLGYTSLIIVYNSCDIWLSTSTLEGFHNVPAEANLCGCLVCGIRHPRNGTADYLNEETGILFDTVEEAVEKLKDPDFSKVDKMQVLLREKIGDRQRNMAKLLEVIG